MLKSIQRVPPQSVEAEQHLLGAMMLKPELFDQVRMILTVDDFYRPEHRPIFAAIEGGALDIVMVVNKLKDANQLEGCGGPAYIDSLTDIIPTTATALAHATRIKQESKKRRFISRACEMVEQCYEGFDFGNMAADLEQEAFALAAELSTDEAEHIGPVVRKELARVEKIINKEVPPGLMTGFADFDAMTGGLQAGNLVIVAARPSMGKTALALNITRKVSDTGKAVGVFSLEMSKAALGARMCAEVSGVNFKVLQRGWSSEKSVQKVFQSAKYFDGLPVFIDDTPALHISEMRSRARRLHRKHNLELVVVDYLQMARGDGGNREQEISSISRGLKAMAKELGIPVMALSQLSRKCEERTDKRPMLSDLRESGAIEQDADVICFIYRDEVYNKGEGNPKKGIAELNFGKQRDGPTGAIEMMWKAETSSFHDLARGYDNG